MAYHSSCVDLQCCIDVKMHAPGPCASGHTPVVRAYAHVAASLIAPRRRTGHVVLPCRSRSDAPHGQHRIAAPSGSAAACMYTPLACCKPRPTAAWRAPLRSHTCLQGNRAANLQQGLQRLRDLGVQVCTGGGGGAHQGACKWRMQRVCRNSNTAPPATPAMYLLASSPSTRGWNGVGTGHAVDKPRRACRRLQPCACMPFCRPHAVPSLSIAEPRQAARHVQPRQLHSPPSRWFCPPPTHTHTRAPRCRCYATRRCTRQRPPTSPTSRRSSTQPCWRGRRWSRGSCCM